ncbi:MAG: multiheme c-type cytochrome [Myxococcota bacterium]
MFRSALLFALVAFAGCRTPQPDATPTTPVPPAPVKVNEVAAALAPGITLDPNDPATCEACHTAVVGEWRESLHARAHHSKDPLYGALRTLRLEKQGPHIPGECASCHNPRDPKDHESVAAQGGVTCAVCHQLDAVHLADGKKGVQTFVIGPEKRFRGVHDIADGTAPLHASGPALPELQDGTTLCLACHGEEKNAAGVPTCTTGPEYVASKETKSCAACHMKETEGASGPVVTTRTTHRSHRFLGPHQQHRLATSGMLEEAVGLTGRFDGDKVVAKLENRSAHGFPTGFPARMALLEVRALDAGGKVLAQNITQDPMKEHPEAVFNRGYVDAEGKPSLAPFSAKLVRDNRLKPAETREVAFAVPPQTVKAELRLKFFLLAPFAAKQLAYTGPETKPVVLAPVVVAR